MKVEHPGNAQPCSIGINTSLTVLGRNCEATLVAMPGTWGKVLRIVSLAALVVGVAAGCGGASRPQQPRLHGVPHRLAQAWEGQASQIAAAASAGDSCRAMHLADSLRDQVRAAEHKLPPRLRSPLVIGVDRLADGLTCTVTTMVTVPQKPKPKPPGKHDHHDDHGHRGGGGDGGGNDQ